LKIKVYGLFILKLSSHIYNRLYRIYEEVLIYGKIPKLFFLRKVKSNSGMTEMNSVKNAQMNEDVYVTSGDESGDEIVNESGDEIVNENGDDTSAVEHFPLDDPLQPWMGLPMMGQPWMGQPWMGQPGMGLPWMGQPGMGQPWMGQPMMGQPWMGQPWMGQPWMGQPWMGQPGMGLPCYPQPMMGQPGMGPPQPWMGPPQDGYSSDQENGLESDNSKPKSGFGLMKERFDKGLEWSEKECDDFLEEVKEINKSVSVEDRRKMALNISVLMRCIKGSRIELEHEFATKECDSIPSYGLHHCINNIQKYENNLVPMVIEAVKDTVSIHNNFIVPIVELILKYGIKWIKLDNGDVMPVTILNYVDMCWTIAPESKLSNQVRGMVHRQLNEFSRMKEYGQLNEFSRMKEYGRMILPNIIGLLPFKKVKDLKKEDSLRLLEFCTSLWQGKKCSFLKKCSILNGGQEPVDFMRMKRVLIDSHEEIQDYIANNITELNTSKGIELKRPQFDGFSYNDLKEYKTFTVEQLELIHCVNIPDMSEFNRERQEASGIFEEGDFPPLE
jgi:hypothetical protein